MGLLQLHFTATLKSHESHMETHSIHVIIKTLQSYASNKTICPEFVQLFPFYCLHFVFSSSAGQRPWTDNTSAKQSLANRTSFMFYHTYS